MGCACFWCKGPQPTLTEFDVLFLAGEFLFLTGGFDIGLICYIIVSFICIMKLTFRVILKLCVCTYWIQKSQANIFSKHFTLHTESGILELKLKALILDIIHNIDVVKHLNQVQVHTTEDWAWKKQVRFYMKSDHTCYIQMVDCELQYTYEYQVWLVAEVFHFFN